ncbi:MAG TPA: DUF5667 domain-containing protein [Candidatus Dormibacteraeota bacterium]|nr:DUF5667 domain-containing protein [Candidatus Dormibacteraeota bacterium]
MLQEPSPHQLEDALGRRRGGAAIIEATGIHPAAEQLEALLKLGDEIGALAGAQPDAGAVARLREQTMADVVGHRAAWVHHHRLPVHRGRHPLPSHGFRWTFVLGIAIMLALVAGVSLALAAQLAEPDGSLYRVKLDTEQVLLAVNRSPTSKASVRLQLASQRYRDTEAMAAVGKGAYAVQAMAAYYDELRQAGGLLATAHRDSGWKSVRDQFDAAEAKPIDTILTQLENTHQAVASTEIKALAARFGRDRKAIDAKLNPSSASSTPAPLPSGAAPQPGGGSQPSGTPTP